MDRTMFGIGLLLSASFSVLAPGARAALRSVEKALSGEPIRPVPMGVDATPARTEIGRRLFSDVRLSGNGKVSCSSCHDLRRSGADPRGKGIGVGGVATEVTVPSIFNAALNFRQFWNGRAASLEAQVDEVVRSPVEMGSRWSDVVARINVDPDYRSAFAAAYREGVTPANIQNAIASFERTQLTPNARFDQYLRGEENAISAQEKRGYAAFKRFGCIACHQGVNVGGNMFQKFGVMSDYFARRGSPQNADQGRFLVTRLEGDRHVFKVPSLRNVALRTAYFHDGSANTLDEAVDVMFKFQLGRIATAADKAAITAFLRTLTGERPAAPR
ncbi:MAG: cytochrome c peroxidase [Burkholderiaceae bacterium]